MVAGKASSERIDRDIAERKQPINVIELIPRDRIGLVDGIISKLYRGKWIPQWAIEQTPIAHRRIILNEEINNSKQLIDLQIGDDRNIVGHYELKKGIYTDMFPMLSGTLDERSFKQFANVIDALSKLSNVPVCIGITRLGVHKDFETGMFFRILPNGNIRGFDTDKFVYYSPEKDESFTIEQWEERLNYKEVSKEQQEIDYNYFKKMVHDNIGLLNIVHNIGTMLGWIHGNGYKHGNVLYWLAEQGTGKTWLSRIGISTMYPYSEEYNGNANFEGTYASIVNIFSKLDYTPSFLDDAHLHDFDKKNTDKIMNTLTRKRFNNDSVRGKSMRSGEVNAPIKYIRTNFMVTAENLDNIEASTRTRSLIIPLNPVLIDRSSDNKYSLLKTYEHIISIYQWSDTIDNYVLNFVNQYGYDVMLNNMREKYQQYREEILQDIKKKWLMIFNKNTSQSIDRMSFIGAYYYVIADLMQEILDLPFLTDIKQLILNLIYNQLRYVDIGIEVTEKENSVNPALEGLLEIFEAVLAKAPINGISYRIEVIDKLDHSFEVASNKNDTTIFYQYDDFFLFPSAFTNVWLNTIAVKGIKFNHENDKYKKHFLGEMLDNANILYMKPENDSRYDILSPRIGGKQIRGLALKKDIIISHFPNSGVFDGFNGVNGFTASQANSSETIDGFNGVKVKQTGTDSHVPLKTLDEIFESEDLR